MLLWKIEKLDDNYVVHSGNTPCSDRSFTDLCHVIAITEKDERGTLVLIVCDWSEIMQWPLWFVVLD